VLSVIAPMTQLNTPVPVDGLPDGLPALARHRRGAGRPGAGPGAGAAVGRRLGGCARADRRAAGAPTQPADTAFAERFERYRATIGPTVAFLQGHDATLAHRICSRHFLPEGPRFDALEVYVDPTAATRWPGPSARSECRTARATWPRCT